MPNNIMIILLMVIYINILSMKTVSAVAIVIIQLRIFNTFYFMGYN